MALRAQVFSAGLREARTVVNDFTICALIRVPVARCACLALCFSLPISSRLWSGRRGTGRDHTVFFFFGQAQGAQFGGFCCGGGLLLSDLSTDRNVTPL